MVRNTIEGREKREKIEREREKVQESVGTGRRREC
jgi:hypothetical protein